MISSTLAITLVLALTFEVQAQQAGPGASEPDVVDIATTPLTDLNIKSDEIPELLLQAQQSPYSLAGLEGCRAIIGEVDKFNVLLGDDFDLPRDMPGGTNAGAIGKAAVGSFMPFRGLVREVSGASGRERALGVALQAGYARRGFLKGIGQRMGCRYPGRPASENDILNLEAEREEALSE
jgi:hypothetical protein